MLEEIQMTQTLDLRVMNRMLTCNSGVGKPAACDHRLLETVPASVFRLSGRFAAALRAISRYRERRLFRGCGRLR
ncbi:hypothetical protein [Paraburkholderia aromaticivorans]|uniref:hypothetical protein n=1 Tax=Paraburkholderia aromaticivorans TaxID=2026199 RepID=UPI00145621BA|nr:hypothetical protein [Paraburkholderia aromaticivorans]